MNPMTIECSSYAIAVDWYEGTATDKVTILLPGYSSSKARIASLAQEIVSKTGSSALVVDFSGHGESPFELRDTRPAQHFLELIYVFDWVKAKYPDAEITVEGSSYGGFLAVQLTKYREFAKLILIAPAIYRPNEFYNLWSVRIGNEEHYRVNMAEYRKNAEALAKHPLLARASAFKGKTLVVVHENDELVPRETTDAYIKAFGADSFVAIGVPHSFNATELDESQIQAYRHQITDWLMRA